MDPSVCNEWELSSSLEMPFPSSLGFGCRDNKKYLVNIRHSTRHEPYFLSMLAADAMCMVIGILYDCTQQKFRRLDARGAFSLGRIISGLACNCVAIVT